MTIPISQVVQVLPGVITAGGTPSRLSGLVMSQDTSLAPGQAPRQFFTAADVSTWFGPNAPETTIANNYFPGTVNAGQLPYVLKFAGYALAAAPAGSYGASLSGLTLAGLQALSGTLVFTINGTQYTSGNINLASATSFGNAATLMQAAFLPASPLANGALSQTATGLLAATTYYVKSTWVSALGESIASAETSFATSVSNVLNVASPGSAPAGATGWNVYVSRTSGGETLQNGAPIAVGTAWTEPASGLYQGGTGMPVQLSTNGTLSQVAGGSLAGATYYVKSSFVNAQGESLQTPETSLAVSANNVLVVGTPSTPPAGATGWNVFVWTSAGGEVKQNAAPIAIGTSWTMPTSGLIGTVGITPPTDGAATQVSVAGSPGGNFFLRATWVTATGESFASAGASVVCAGGQGPSYASPASPPAGAIGWNAYVFSTTGVGGGGYKQNATPIAIGTPWVLPTTGLLIGPTGPAAPTPATAQPFNIAYDATRNRYTLLTLTGGPTQTSTDIGGTLAPGVRLASSAGAYIATVGVAADTPASAMSRVVTLDTNWGVFSTAYAASLNDRLAYASWNSGQAYQYVYLGWDTDAASTSANNAASFGAQAFAAPYQGTWPVYGTQALAGALMGYVAGVNFSVPNGRTTAAFRQFNSAPAATVTDLATANALLSNQYTYLGAYANQANAYTVSYAGSISGAFLWVDTYSAIYNNALPVIDNAVTAGIIRSGVTLSQSQIQQVNAQAGRDVANVLQTRGWYLLIADPGNPSQARQQRTTPTAYLWYVDGGSIQAITIRSIAVI